ncbi:MAG: hypothetical protein HYS51_00435 [Candidatus Zambryskibacteria bacterium]|nr:hypothetical protein [Candidatus Zambryskibacteria bacterium]
MNGDDDHYVEFRKLYPNLTEEEAIEAADNLDAYLETIIAIYEDLRNDSGRYQQFLALTDSISGGYTDPVNSSPT